MRKKYALLALSLILGIAAFSQNQYYIDSLTAKVKTDKPGYEKALDYFLISEEWGLIDSAHAAPYWAKALDESKNITDPGQKLEFKVKEFYHYFNQSQTAAGYHRAFASKKAKSVLLDELGPLLKNKPMILPKYYVAWGMYMTHDHKECDSSHLAIAHAFDTAISMIGTKDNDELAKAYAGEMIFYLQDAQKEKIVALAEKAIPVFETLSPKNRTKFFSTMGVIYGQVQNDSKAFDAYSKAYASALICRDSLSIGGLMSTLLSPKYYNGDPEDFKKQSEKAIGILKRNVAMNPDKTNRKISIIYSKLAEQYYYEVKKDTFNTLNSYRLALYYNRLGKDAYGEPLILGNMGIQYLQFGYADSALAVQKQALEMRLKFNNQEGVLFSYSCLADIYLYKKDYSNAIVYATKSMEVSEQNKMHNYDDHYLSVLSEAYAKQANFKLAYTYMNKLYVYNDSTSKLKDKQDVYRLKGEQKEAKLKADFDQKTALAKADQEKKDAIAAADSKRQKLFVLFSLIIAIILGGVAFVIFRSLKTTRKQKAEIEKQKTLVEQQKDLVEEKNKEILDSITYAKRLQDAILPPLTLVKQFLPDSFVLYKPKDIVAGDFYWMEKSGDTILIAAADCTGHGVPGALVSVVCSNALNRTVKEFKITEPGKILDKVRELVLETFEKSESNVQDGMDISLCCINTQTKEVLWSGAYNPLWYVQNGELKEVAPDKQPIGKHDVPKPFSTNSLNLMKGDILYLFTDGYADQFGGPKGKKFKYKQLQEKLLAISGRAMDTQKEELDNVLEEWKGNLEQVDDVLLIGIRV